ncbi:MAG TPA: hypothetical protein VGI81_00080 [Tepidisphaeraceae bacterium]|jgi:hypothetical protein
MRSVAAEQFLAWAAEHGIGPDERYPHSNSFAYLPPPNEWLALDAPTETLGLIPFLSDVLDGIGEWQECLVWHRTGPWPDYSGEDDPCASLYSFMLGGAGIPLGFDGAIAFGRSDRHRLIAAAAAPILFGRTVWEDVLLFPDHGKLFLQCDHHQDVTLTFSEPPLAEPFMLHMRERGHEVDD